jgi:hypothetical protein
MEKDPELVKAVVNNMPADARRRLVVTGAAHEWFGSDSVASEVKRADANEDRTICPKDFDKWFEEALRRKSGGSQPADAEASTAGDGGAPGNPAAPVPLTGLLLVALEAGLPFIGFGFLDNATMILAGDAIDRSLAVYLNCSVMASAAMGNVCSGVMGMQVHGFVEKLIQKLGLPVPVLSEEQRRSNRVFFAGHIGGTLGIAFGLTLGLLPLFLISDENQKAELKAFHQLDLDDDGNLDEGELGRAMTELGMPLPREAAKAILAKFGTDKKMSFQQFQEACAHLREMRHVVAA